MADQKSKALTTDQIALKLAPMGSESGVTNERESRAPCGTVPVSILLSPFIPRNDSRILFQVNDS